VLRGLVAEREKRSLDGNGVYLSRLKVKHRYPLAVPLQLRPAPAQRAESHVSAACCVTRIGATRVHAPDTPEGDALRTGGDLRAAAGVALASPHGTALAARRALHTRTG
jgi:hypothetical protein